MHKPQLARRGLRSVAPTCGAAVFGLGVALPERVVSTTEISDNLGIDQDWIVSRTGIKERRHAAPGVRASDLAAQAGRAVLERTGVAADSVDIVLVATLSQDELTPNTAPIVAHELGCTRAGAWDVGAACNSWMSALATATGLVESGRVENVLVIGVDVLSRYTDFQDKATAGLFADGAGAVLVGRSEGESRIGPFILGADGAEAPSLYANWDDRLMRMDGPRVFKHAVVRMKEAALAATAAAGVTLEEIDLFVLHQANARITRSITERLGVAPERVVSTIELLGNSSAATLPLTLAAAGSDGRLFDGARVLLAAFGAGFVWGGVVIDWGRVDA